MQDLTFLGDPGTAIDPEVQQLVVGLVRCHSIHSSRAQLQHLPSEWMPLAKVVQIADMYSSAYALGYLRAFSYSGHVFKSLLSRIRTIHRDPSRFQAPLPRSLARLLSDSQLHLHAWVLSIMMKTNQNFVGKFSESEGAIKRFMERGLRLGVDPRATELATGLRIRPVEGSPGEFEVLMEPAPGAGRSPLDVLRMRAENKKYFTTFETLITELDQLAALGLRDQAEPDPAILGEVLSILDQGFIGLCSRAFWCQLNPRQADGQESVRFQTLDEQIEHYSSRSGDDPQGQDRLEVRTLQGTTILEKSQQLGDELARAAQRQLAMQRWAVGSWDQLQGAG